MNKNDQNMKSDKKLYNMFYQLQSSSLFIIKEDMHNRWGEGPTFKSIFTFDSEPLIFDKSLIFCACLIFLL